MGTFQYKPRTETDWQRRSQQSASKYAGIIDDAFKTFSAKKGDNWIRILPPTWENPLHYGMDIFVHYGVGPDNGQVLCLAKMKNQKCPMCEAYQRAEAAGREDAVKLKWTKRVLIWLVDMKDEKRSEPVAWAMPWTVDRDVSIICKDRQTGELYQIDNPDSGYDVMFDKVGDQQNTKYTGIAIARRPTAVEAKYVEYAIKNPLPTVLLWRSYQEIEALFGGEPVDAQSPEPQQQQQAPEPAPVQVQPAKTNGSAKDAICVNRMKFKGQLLGCGLPLGHAGDCDYSLPMVDVAVPKLCQSQVKMRGITWACSLQEHDQSTDHDYSREVGATGVPSPPQSESPVVSTPAPASSTATALRNRFVTGVK